MTFTYDPTAWPTDGGTGLPVAPPLARVRQLLGDTDEHQAFLQDEEINALLHVFGAAAVERVAYESVSIIEAKMAREVDESGAGITTARSQKFTQMRDIKRDLERRIIRTATPKFIGGSRSAIDAIEQDSDYRGSEIGRGMGGRRVERITDSTNDGDAW